MVDVDMPSNSSVSAEDVSDQFRVLMEALAKYAEREKQYGSMWKRYGCRDAADHCRSKAGRLDMAIYRMLKGGEDVNDGDIDDAIDLINYAVFFIRHAREGRMKLGLPYDDSEDRVAAIKESREGS